jgi:hypothetical protein
MTELILRIENSFELEQLLPILQQLKIKYQTLTPTETDKGYFSVAQLKHLYPNEWLLLADTRMNELELLGGRVILRATDKRQLALQGRDLVKQYANVRHYYAGEVTPRRHIGLMVRKNPSNNLL